MLGWRPELAAAARELEARLAGIGSEEFSRAVDREVRAEADKFLRGLERYRGHPYRRRLPPPKVVWSEGTTRLLDYAPGGGRPVLVVPSLINRYYILDLAPRESLLRFLAGEGLRPLVVDWDRPGEIERSFSLTDYVAGRLEAALDAALAQAGGAVAIVGYCMGGLLALALAQRRRRDVWALALLATPWDFHAEMPAQAALLSTLAEPLTAAFAPIGEVPVDVLQALFAGLDPLLALRKFSRFAGLDPAGEAARRFVALEDWLNDGVPLALPVARESLTEWYGANAPGRNVWRVAGRIVDPAELGHPALVVLPGQDRIVPPRSARALADRLPRADRLSPPLGHIGMIVGGRAETSVWRPLSDWLRQRQRGAAGLGR